MTSNVINASDTPLQVLTKFKEIISSDNLGLGAEVAFSITMTDAEDALGAAIDVVFPDASQGMCWCHVEFNVKKHIKQMSVQRRERILDHIRGLHCTRDEVSFGERLGDLFEDLSSGELFAGDGE